MKIAVFLPNWVGDVVMATPTLRALRSFHPEAKITCVLKPDLSDLLYGNANIDELLPCDHRAGQAAHRPWNVVKRIRHEQFDIGVLLTNSLRSAILAWAGGVKRRVGYARDGRSFFLHDRLEAARTKRGWTPSPVIDYYLRLAYHLGAPKTPYQMDLAVSPADETAADDAWRRCGFSPIDRVVALNPGAAFGSSKRWPSDLFAELARRLAAHNLKVLVVCGPNEAGFARYIADASGRPRSVKSLAEVPPSLGLTKAVVKRSTLLVSTDSGPRHFAPAFNVPVVALFGSTHQAWTETYFAEEFRLQRDVPCGPCQQRVCPLGHHRCMKELSVDEVFAASLKALGLARVRPGRVA
jgi:heptosyltransferase II